MNQDEHEYMHAHGIPHEHSHDNENSHDHDHHDHAHDHGSCSGQEGCGHDCAVCPADPKAEIVALMKYMVGHNAAHANELAQLAEKLRATGETVAAEQVLAAVSDFEKGNMRLSTVLAALS